MKSSFMFKIIRVIVVLSLAFLIAGLLIKMRPKAERQERTETIMLVDVMPAKAENLKMTIETYGTVQPREALNLVAEVRGRIVGLHSSFKEGAFIEKGTALIKIDPRTYQLEVERRKVQVDQADAELKRLRQEVKNIKATLNIVKSDVALARAEFSRSQKLSENNVVSQTNLDNAEQRYLSSLERLQSLENQMALTGPMRDQLEAQRDMAKVLLRQAELDLERTSIVAPFNGWTIEKTVEEGQHVTIGQYLGRIYLDGALDIDVHIPGADIKWLPPTLTPESTPEAEISMNSSDSSGTWKGRVSRVKAKMDEKTRTLPVVVEVDENPGSKKTEIANYLRPGMFVNVKIKGREVGQVFVIPRYTVHAGDLVYIVRDNRLRIRPVSILRRYKDTVFVEDGLSDGDLLVTTPLSAATDGMKVKVNKESS